MLKYISKFALDVLPSVAATVIGAYVVNHYIVARPGMGVPVNAVVSSVDPKADSKNTRPARTSSDVGNIPEAGVRAKGISEKAVFERPIGEKPAAEKASGEKFPAEKFQVDKSQIDKPQVEKPAEKSADRPAETASIPPDTRRQPALREKTVAKTVPAAPVAAVAAPAQPAVTAVVPVVVAPNVVAPNTAPPVEAVVAPEEHRDATDLARAAIERLRGVSEGSPHAQEAARIPDAPRAVSAPPAAVRPLPPPIVVSSPSRETPDPGAGSSAMRQPYPTTARIDDPRRLIPPADIPAPEPLDLRADAADPATRAHSTVAEDMLSAAKSVFHAVLPR
jgi:hypothetical protein